MIGKVCCELIMEISNVASEVHNKYRDIEAVSTNWRSPPFF